MLSSGEIQSPQVEDRSLNEQEQEPEIVQEQEPEIVEQHQHQQEPQIVDQHEHQQEPEIVDQHEQEPEQDTIEEVADLNLSEVQQCIICSLCSL